MNKQRFIERYCRHCGSQRCEGIDTEWFEGCLHKDELTTGDSKSMEKKYKLGMYLGRFQPFHNGHKAIVDKMLEECESVVIVVGSAQEKGTVKNPFPSWERAIMIASVYQNKPVSILCMPDRLTVGNDSSWGDYVMEYLHSHDYNPDAIYQGYEVERNTWFEHWDIDIVNLSRVDNPISATVIRAAMVEGREDFIKENCPPEVAEHIIKSIYWGRDFHE